LPQSLFFKIFLWFCLVTITVIGATFIVGELARPEPFRRFHHGPPEPPISIHAEEAVEAYEREGSNGLTAYLDQIERETNLRGFLYDTNLRELSYRQPPPEATTVAQQTMAADVGEFRSRGFPPLVARPVRTSSGAEYVFVVQLPARRSGIPFPNQLLHVLGVALIGAAFCYWLARYLTSPVGKLRSATQEFARGNLGVRVGPQLGNRRDELTSLGADFDLMAEQIETLIKSQRRLLGDISHELRSPLTRLNVALELARQRAGADATTALERIQREAENLNEMIGQLLALTRLETGTVSDEKTEVDLVDLARDIAADADYEARSRQRSVVLTSVERCRITGNRELLRRAIDIVVRNAVHYTKEGTAVGIDVSINTVGEATSTRAKSNLVITVRDHGTGVPEESLSKIFEPFHRVDEARDRESGGTGLGLAIAQRAVKLHGGTVTARNAEGGGLIVTITLRANSKA
jgi:two-component system sensor histidine kinase CpxA